MTRGVGGKRQRFIVLSLLFSVLALLGALTVSVPGASAQSMGWVQGPDSITPGSILQVYADDCPWYMDFTVTYYDVDGYTIGSGGTATSRADFDDYYGVHWTEFQIPSNWTTSGTFVVDAVCIDANGYGLGSYTALQVPVGGYYDSGDSGYTDPGSGGSSGYAGTIYITIDDGPSPTYTPQMLDVLARYGAQATFFTIGQNVQAYPWLAQAVVGQGHAIANHSWSHPDFRYLGYDSQAAQLAETNWMIYQTTGYSPSCFRPPYGAMNNSAYNAVANAGLDNWFWTVDTNDWRRPGSQSIANSIVNGAYDGSVILIHDGGGNRSQTVAGLDAALNYLTQQGYVFRALPGC